MGKQKHNVQRPSVFKVSRFSSRPKRSKIFSSVSVFPNLLSSVCTKTIENDESDWGRDCVFVKVQQDHKTIRHLGKMLRFGLEPMACDAFYVTVFKSFRFHLSTLETERFQNDAFSKVSTFVKSSFSGVLSVDGRRKRIKKCAFSNQNALVCIGPNN